MSKYNTTLFLSFLHILLLLTHERRFINVYIYNSIVCRDINNWSRIIYQYYLHRVKLQISIMGIIAREHDRLSGLGAHTMFLVALSFIHIYIFKHKHQRKKECCWMVNSQSQYTMGRRFSSAAIVRVIIRILCVCVPNQRPTPRPLCVEVGGRRDMWLKIIAIFVWSSSTHTHTWAKVNVIGNHKCDVNEMI